ncbi:aminotransferase class I/II-fold pyridoxal phosphate-dependent enzyme [Micromonospora sp. ATA51]|uniref:aminotransferase class I/II-fold pyridoxal phosphate-dependent enzyme n=1 Tax=Micromonospora sp. ATA51 TaxID=2806098 RepID=UPI001A426805|nr:aminotransferase class I/II-fold pyridoxal phosphate-dependent enzyme [Micromonospora sp. ATA51]MBM0230366.1 aminotransferase class I/II-fold pyridoxal phosphate-dependent enzyme [Micromonospora sp. ATA51]
MVTAGYVQALVLLTTVLRDAGRAVLAMEDPGLPFHREVVRRQGGRVVPLPVDDRGARRAARRGRAGRCGGGGGDAGPPVPERGDAAPGPPARADRLGPGRRCPGGRGRLRRRVPLRPAAGGRGPGHAPEQVAYVGTAAKTLGPALRLAWLVLPARLVEAVVEAKRHLDVQTEVVGQLALADLIDSHGYDRQVRTVRRHYRQRRDLLLDRLGGRLAGGISAGLHAVVPLPPDGPSEAEVLALAAARGLALDGLDGHRHHPGGQPPGLVVGYATPPSYAYPAALATLAEVLGTAAAPA